MVRRRWVASDSWLSRRSRRIQWRAKGGGTNFVDDVRYWGQPQTPGISASVRWSCPPFAHCPQIQQCYYVAGEWDFVLIFAVRNMDQYTELTRELFFSNNNVKRFKTLVSMSRVKVGLEVPLALDGE